MKQISVIFIFLAFFGIFINGCGKKPPNRTFRIARDITWYPLNLYGREDNLLGFIDELIIAVAKEKELQVQLVYASANTLISGMNSNHYEAAVTSLLPNEVSHNYYLFSDPLYLLGVVLVIPASSQIETVQQLQEKTIGIERGSAAAFDIIRYPTVFVRPYESINTALENLARNGLDGVLMPAIPAYIATQGSYHGRLKIATEPLTDLGLRLITKNEPDEETFISLFNEGLETLKENGAYAKLCLKWGLYNPESIKTDIPKLPEKTQNQIPIETLK